MAILFGPSGNSESFYKEGNQTTFDTPSWLKKRGLDLFEYSFGQGYRMSSETALKIGDAFEKEGIEISIHAPYFINFSNPDPIMYDKSLGYIRTGIKFMENFHANRLVFHSASCGKESRDVVIERLMSRFKEFMPEIEKELKDGMFLCPETMGKTMQIGTYKEIIDLCTISDKLMPTFDFGHINALTQGSLKTPDDFQRIFDYSFEKLGEYRTKHAHIHFSKIEYGSKGEIRHLTFDDHIFGPFFEPLCDILIKNDMENHVICESAGTQAEDALYMKNIYLSKRETNF